MRYCFISFMFIFMFNNFLFAKEITISWPSIWVAKDSKAKVISQLVNEFNQANSGKIKVVLEGVNKVYKQSKQRKITFGFRYWWK